MRRAVRTCMAVAAVCAVAACANTVTVPPPLKTLIFKISVRGQIRGIQDLRYCLAIDANGDPNDGPKPYGPWPKDKPLIGWDLPFYIIPQTRTTGIFNPPVEASSWTDLFLYTAVANQPVFQHWVQVPDKDFVRKIEPRPNLVPGQDFKLANSNFPSGAAPGPGTPGFGENDTLELSLVLNRYIAEDKLKELKQLEANLVVQIRPPDSATDFILGGWKIDQWYTNDTVYFSVPLDPTRPAERKDSTHGTPLYPQNIPAGLTPDDLTFKAYASEFKETASGQ